MSEVHSTATGVADGCGVDDVCGTLGDALGCGITALGDGDGVTTGSPMHPLRLNTRTSAVSTEPRRAVDAEIPMVTILSCRQSHRECNADDEPTQRLCLRP